MAVNPNYPVIDELWGPVWGAAGVSIPSGRWVNVVDRTLSQASAKRGKQYELDQAQAGDYSITLGSQDGALDPTNAAGPFGGKILPFQPYQRRAQWPPTPNLLTAVQASAGEGYSTGAIPASFNVKSQTDASGGVVAVPGGSLTAYQGTNVFRFAALNGAAAGSRICYTDGVGVAPGKTFTVSMRVRNVTASTTASVKAVLAFYGPDPLAAPVTSVYGTVTPLTGSATANVWATVTVTATAPTTGGVFGMCAGVAIGATVAADCAIEVDGWQVERASSATAWTLPGTWYPLFSGFTERWPTVWGESGTYGQVSPTAVDAFALLSQVTLGEVFAEEIASHNPRFCYALGDPAGSTEFADATGSNPNAKTLYGKAGSGNWTAGNTITATSSTGGFTGSTGTVVTASPLTAGTSANSPATMLSLSSAGLNGPGTSAWTRMVAFRYTAGSLPTDLSYIWSGIASAFGTASSISLYIDSTGALRLYTNATGSITVSTPFSGPSNVADGNWHLAIFGVDRSTNTLSLSLDGVTSTATVSASLMPIVGGMSDYLGANYSPYLRTAQYVFKGSLAFVTEFPSLLGAADMADLYLTWRSSAAGESSNARYARILEYSGFQGASSIGTGLTTAMGPASDLAGADVMTALSNVVTTENGDQFVSGDGTVTFVGRGARYNARTPALVLGDGPGEMPYEDLQLDFDSTHLANVVEVTHQGSGQMFRTTDSASVAAYFARPMSRTLNTASTSECQDAGAYLLSRYKAPMSRVQSVKLHPSAAPSLWPTLLALELGTRITINRRPVGAPLVSLDCFVEQITWDMDSNGEAFVTLQASPADPVPYVALGAFRTTLNTATSVGGASLILNAGGGADSANPLAAQLPKGTQLVVGLGTANQETVTLLSVGSTVAGWSTGTVTLSGTLSKAHSAGVTVSEVLPTGVTDPASYDSADAFGKAVFAY